MISPTSISSRLWPILKGALLGALLALAACSVEKAEREIDRSNPMNLDPRPMARGLGPNLEGRWKDLWPYATVELTSDGAGRYTGRLIEANPRCGLDEPGGEVLRGRLDDEGIFSGEFLVCASIQCAGVDSRWIYFMALATSDANGFAGAVAPTALPGCNALFRGIPLQATREAFQPQRQARPRAEQPSALAAALAQQDEAPPALAAEPPPPAAPFRASTTSVALRPEVSSRPPAISAQPKPKVLSPPRQQPCKTSSKKGYVDILLPAGEELSIRVDGKSHTFTPGKAPYKRVLPAGQHTIVLKQTTVLSQEDPLEPSQNTIESTRSVCVEAGKTVSVDFRK
ncbi:MAG: hypothetical protein LBM75_08385 [Myxococcales bacterium]|jgi:hypothetical protein|nr:hypothetical protein [Myxococcales bacterium]